jgi:hypothetical protein
VRLRIGARIVISKNHAAPKLRMPAHSNTTHHRRCNDDRCRHHDTRSDYDWRGDYYYRPSIRPTPAKRPTVKAGTASAGSTGTVDAEQ